MANAHFFEDAPCFGWWQYIQDSILSTQRSPQLLPNSEKMPQKVIRSPCGTFPSRMKPEKSHEYTQFLERHFYPESHTHSLQLPEKHVSAYLSSQHWIGAEVRDTRGTLVGIAVSKSMGNEPTLKAPMGMIDYLCVHPMWRKKGITNVLLRAVYTFSSQQTPSRSIQFFQKEGLPATIPPISMTRYYTRSPRKYTSQIPIDRIPFEKYSVVVPYIQDTMKDHAIKLFPPTWPIKTSEIQIYETKTGAGILLHPTYEINKTTNRLCATILGWYVRVPNILPMLSYELEGLLDSIPGFGHYYAPSFYPRLDCMGWSYAGIISTHAFHYDPGNPKPSHIISLCTA